MSNKPAAGIQALGIIGCTDKFRAISIVRFQQVCLILPNNFSTSLWLSTTLRCISVQPKIECHVDDRVIDQSAVRGHVATLRSNGVAVTS